MKYRMLMWLLRRERPMPLFSSWSGEHAEYVSRAEPIDIVASMAIHTMAEEAL